MTKITTITTTTIRISKRKLAEYNRTLSERDKAVLDTVKMCHYLKTSQVSRLHFEDISANPTAALRAATRTLTKLHHLGLVQPLRRRIGGVRAGSASYVWTLKTAGAELLRLVETPLSDGKMALKKRLGGTTESQEVTLEPHKGTMESQKITIEPYRKKQAKSRKRIYEPSHIFLKHTLAVSELYTRLCGLCGLRTAVNLAEVEFEPLCWRRYITALGIDATLKPDLYAVTATGGFLDHWFFEVDLCTEEPSRIVRKCESYGRYYFTDNEQKRTGVFPRVVWLVPDEKRKQTIRRYIRDNLSEYKDLFAVVTFQGLDSLIRTGSDG